MSWLTSGDAAHILTCSSERVRQLERQGVLTAERTTNGTRLFRADDIALLAAQRREAIRSRTATLRKATRRK